MATRKPVVIIDGQLRQLPEGDDLGISGGSSVQKEPVAVFNNGAPEILFAANGDVVMCDVS